MESPDDRSCPGEDEILAVLDSAAPERSRVLQHVACCTACRFILSDAARVASDVGSGATNCVPTTLLSGEVVDERFEIVGTVGRGGMGEVYRARDRLLDEVVALKTIACALSDDPSTLERFRSEAQLARRVSHPNVCRILEYGVHRRRSGERIPYLTMPLLEGRTLAAFIADSPRPDVRAIRELALQMLDGLAAIHAEGIIHRDLKSENVFLVSRPDGRWRVMLMDFGLARSAYADARWRSAANGTVVGTPAYIAPEQLLDAPATARSDLYSLGVVLFELITGRLPFERRSAVATAVSRLHEVAPRLKQLAPEVPDPWDAVLARCLARDPMERFASVAEMRAAISETRRTPRWTAFPAIATLTATLVVSMIALLGRGAGGSNRDAAANLATEDAAASTTDEDPPASKTSAAPPADVPLALPRDRATPNARPRRARTGPLPVGEERRASPAVHPPVKQDALPGAHPDELIDPYE